MYLDSKQLNEKAAKLVEMLTPLGFECEHMCRFKHKHTGMIYDFGTIALTIENIIHHIISHTSSFKFLEGEVSRASEIAALLNVKEDADKAQSMRVWGR